MPYAAEIFVRFSALILNCREEWDSVTIRGKTLVGPLRNRESETGRKRFYGC